MKRVVSLLILISLLMPLVACNVVSGPTGTTEKDHVSAEKPVPTETTQSTVAVTNPSSEATEVTEIPTEMSPEETEPTETTPGETEPTVPVQNETTGATVPGTGDPQPAGETVPAGCTYIMANGTRIEAGGSMPTTVALGDEYITADYTYKYGYFFFHHMIAKWHQFTNAMNGWGVVVNDQSKTAYEPLLESINGKKLVSLQECYRDCTNLIAAPVIPDSVQDTTCAFQGCSNLTVASEFPASVKYVSGTYAKCESLVTGVPFPAGVSELNEVYAGCTLLAIAPEIPAGVRQLRGTFSGCKTIKTAPAIPDGVTDIECLFQYCTSITEPPRIPDSVTKMDLAFRGCTALLSAPMIPANVTSISGVLKECTSISKLPQIPAGVTDISEAFLGCTGVTEPTAIPEGVVVLRAAFAECTNLQSAPVLPKTAKDIGELFKNCKSLKNAPVIPEGIEEMNLLFYGCESLETAPAIPNSVKEMIRTFEGCTSLQCAPMIPSHVMDMAYAFQGCTSLTGEVVVDAQLTLNYCGGRCFTCRYDESNCLYCPQCFSGGSCFDDTEKIIVVTGNCNYLEELTRTGGQRTITEEDPEGLLLSYISNEFMGQKYTNVTNAPNYIESNLAAVPGTACVFKVEQTFCIGVPKDPMIGVKSIRILGARINGSECEIYQTADPTKVDELVHRWNAGFEDMAWQAVYLLISPEVEATVSQPTNSQVNQEIDIQIVLEDGTTVDRTLIRDMIFYVGNDSVTSPEDYQ